jgi:hypothetical protein
MNEYQKKIKTQGKKLRTNKLPTRSDILTIMKNFHKISFQDLRKELNVSNAKLMDWYKLVFSTDDKEQRWREIEQNLNQMEFHENFTEAMQSEYIVHDMRRVGDKSFYTIKKKVVNEYRMCYLVTINHGQHVIVRFDIPVERSSVKYCPITLGCDYEVNSLGQWEYMELESHLDVINIQADEDYIGKFWLAISNTLQHEA